MPDLSSPRPASPHMTRSLATATETHSSSSSSPSFSSSYFISFVSVEHLHVAYASILNISSSPLSCPLDVHTQSISTTPPSIRGLDTLPSLELSAASNHSQSYNLHSQVSHPPIHARIRLISPPKSTKIFTGRHFYISKAIIHARVDMAIG